MHAKVEHVLSEKWAWMGRDCQLVLLLKLYGYDCSSKFLSVPLCFCSGKIFRNLFCVVIYNTELR